MRTLLLLSLAVLAGLMGIRLLLPHVVRFFIYHPEPLKPLESDPALWGFPQAEEVRFAAQDGVRLHAWWFPASGRGDGGGWRAGAAGGESGAAKGGIGAAGAGAGAAGAGAGAAGAGAGGAKGEAGVSSTPRGVALYLHGNAGHLAYRGEIAAGLADLDLDILLPDYRGYGLSQGRPDEEGLYRDAEAAYDVALERAGVGPERLVVVGNSLGSAVAVELARRRPVAGLVLLGAFTSTVAVARNAFRWLPASALHWSAHRFDLLSRLSDAGAPLLVAVGEEDRLVPVEEARRVFDAAPSPKRWYVARGVGHDDLLTHPGVWREIRRLVDEAVGERSGTGGRQRRPEARGSK
ncbi:MAG: alpha/beta hydrolase [Gemmatimonadota bacterium]